MKSSFMWNSAVFLSLGLISTSCGNHTVSTSDTSTSGVAASMVGGALNGSTGATMAALPFDRQSKTATKTALCSLRDALWPIHSARASDSCPTIPSTAQGDGCSVSSSTATLTYTECSFNSSAVWNGAQIVAFTGATPVCGQAFPTAMSNVTRTFTSGTTRAEADDFVVTIDTTGSATYTAADGNHYSGGTTLSFSGGVKSSLVINGVNIWSSNFHHSLSTTASGGAPITLGSTGGSVITSGSVVTLHNLAKLKAISTFDGVGFTDGCCTPTSGTIRTSFSPIVGVVPTDLGTKLNGTTETLTFTGCGTANYSGVEGTSGPVSLERCF